LEKEDALCFLSSSLVGQEADEKRWILKGGSQKVDLKRWILRGGFSLYLVDLKWWILRGGFSLYVFLLFSES
jgi:hypothetical protein